MRALAFIILLHTSLVFAWQKDGGLKSTAARKVALVIGNSRYQGGMPEVPPAMNDANDVAQAFRDLKFDVVNVRFDLTLSQLVEVTSEFTSKVVKKGDLAIIYYSGHGGSVKEENYLLPIEYNPPDKAELVEIRAYRMSSLRNAMESSNAAVRVLIFDACRNSPLLTAKAFVPGFGVLKGEPEGTLIAYASAPGEAAQYDVRARNSRYTAELLVSLKNPRLNLWTLLQQVQRSVWARNGHSQTPYLDGFLSAPVYLTDVEPVVSALASWTGQMKVVLPQIGSAISEAERCLKSPSCDKGVLGKARNVIETMLSIHADLEDRFTEITSEAWHPEGEVRQSNLTKVYASWTDLLQVLDSTKTGGVYIEPIRKTLRARLDGQSPEDRMKDPYARSLEESHLLVKYIRGSFLIWHDYLTAALDGRADYSKFDEELAGLSQHLLKARYETQVRLDNVVTRVERSRPLKPFGNSVTSTGSCPITDRQPESEATTCAKIQALGAMVEQLSPALVKVTGKDSRLDASAVIKSYKWKPIRKNNSVEVTVEAREEDIAPLVQ